MVEIKSWSISSFSVDRQSTITFYQHTQIGPIGTLMLTDSAESSYTLLIFSVFDDTFKKNIKASGLSIGFFIYSHSWTNNSKFGDQLLISGSELDDQG